MHAYTRQYLVAERAWAHAVCAQEIKENRKKKKQKEREKKRARVHKHGCTPIRAKAQEKEKINKKENKLTSCLVHTRV